ncbi:signal peptidase II [Frigoribacterium sp. PhB24]|uniref:signal peptidase II n=1 Tax=Frigoribacterium sp. PhB24 TaxID=2485204 RepID=UPI000FA04646|nr:signal peptidase II [Frigoribacterium sp. PhB24]ROS54242.1 signal peptidase II [Frigoribacterium sp. PhB24]
MSSDKPTSKASVRVLATLAFVAVVAYGLDQGTKWLVTRALVEGDSVDVIGEFFQLHFVKNPGAAFSFASGATWIFSIAATGVAVAIVVVARRIRSRAWAIMLGMLLGGTLGNLTDRLLREPSFGQGHVIDFIYFPSLLPAIFNVADVFIVSSMGLLLLLTLLGIGLDGTRTQSAKKARSAEDDGHTGRSSGGDSSPHESHSTSSADTAPPADRRSTS